MPAIISNIEENSIAEDLGLVKGDELLFINTKKPLDYIDYQEALYSEEIEIHIKHPDGTEEIFEIEKDFGEDLGIIFESAVFDRIRPCTNKCVFCFVDQQPKGLRKSLYIKDDDYRLSYLQGTYVTLTNLTDSDRQRIQKLMLGPLYVSVHTTNPELRGMMLKNPKAKNIINELKWLNKIGIPVHAQVVLCPGYNDGKELIRTLKDLEALKSNILSVAIVPVGLTKYREDNNLRKVDKEMAAQVISMVEDFNKKVGYNLANASDEFYILANEGFPAENYYNGYGQLEDGVGSCRMLIDDFNIHKVNLPKAISKTKHLTMVTGIIAGRTMTPIANELNKVENLSVNIEPVKSNFWGDDVTVAGLITGQDIIDKLTPVKESHSDIIIPSVMIRPSTEEFLDGTTVSDVSSALGVNIFRINDYYSTKEIVELVKTFK